MPAMPEFCDCSAGCCTAPGSAPVSQGAVEHLRPPLRLLGTASLVRGSLSLSIAADTCVSPQTRRSNHSLPVPGAAGRLESPACALQAINLMKTQSKGGLIYNMEGAGADGRPTADFAAYGATKRSLRQLNGSLQARAGCSRSDRMCSRPHAFLRAGVCAPVCAHARPQLALSCARLSQHCRWRHESIAKVLHHILAHMRLYLSLLSD